jgi:hypothetical protein
MEHMDDEEKEKNREECEYKIKDYLDVVTEKNISEHENVLNMLRSDESVNVMWQTFTLQYNAVINRNDKISDRIKVRDLSIRYLAALNICRFLYIRFDSVTRILYDVNELSEYTIKQLDFDMIKKHILFEQIADDVKSKKIMELLNIIQEPIQRKNADDMAKISQVIQRHLDIVYTAILLSENRKIPNKDLIQFILTWYSDANIEGFINKRRVFGLDNSYFSTPRKLLCSLLYETLNEFHTYLTDISQEENYLS